MELVRSARFFFHEFSNFSRLEASWSCPTIVAY